MNTGDTLAPSRWFCLRTQPRREYAAAVHLGRRVGVEVFAPRIQLPPRGGAARGFAGTIAEALFPGYLFARFRYPDQLRHVVSTSGVTGIVSFGREPPTVADGVIEFLRAQVQLADRREVAPIFSAGVLVRITAGCFHDMDGRVLSVDSKTERVRVLLSLLGREVQVSVLAQHLRPASDSRPAYPDGLLAMPRTAAPVAQ